jgi:hypothetical protein
MNKDSAINVGIILASGMLGCGWLWYLARLCAGQGLVNMDHQTMTLDLIVVGVASLAGFAVNESVSLSTAGGWCLGQLAFLTWDGMPHGRSPQMFQPTNFLEAFVLGLIIILVLNWSMVPGAVVGSLFKTYKAKSREGEIK